MTGRTEQQEERGKNKEKESADHKLRPLAEWKVCLGIHFNNFACEPLDREGHARCGEAQERRRQSTFALDLPMKGHEGKVCLHRNSNNPSSS